MLTSNHDWRAGYVIVQLDTAGAAVEFVRVEYDVEAAAEAIVVGTLPDEFADFICTGGTLQKSIRG